MAFKNFIFRELADTTFPLHVCVAAIPPSLWTMAGLDDAERFDRFMKSVKKERRKKEEAAAHKANLKKIKGCIESVTFNPPYTTVVWNNGVVTMVSCPDGVEFSKKQGLLNCMAKYLYLNNNNFNNVLTYWTENGTSIDKKKEEKVTDEETTMLGA